LYANISKGFKSGGFQGQLTFDPADLSAFSEEKVLAYELGYKTSILANALQLGGAAFYYDYSDMQMYGPLFYSQQLQTPLYGIDNVGDAKLKGLELEMSWTNHHGFEANLGLGLLATKVVKSVVTGVKTGSELPNSPPINLNANIGYHWNIGDGLTAQWRFSSFYKGDTNYDIVNQPQQTQEEGYWLHNIRFSISAGDSWSLSIFVNNLTDTRYRSQVMNSTVGWSETFGLPRTFGISYTRRH
jgi:iron complex outermembrane receptor protein